MLVSMAVNGKPYRAEVEPRLLLVDYLRDELALTGTKVGCDTGRCGTCIVLINGKSVKSCSLLAAQIEGGEVTTIEGVALNGQMNELQQGFWEMHGLQCGFCTPGMVMSLSELLQHNVSPTADEIRDWLQGTLCRCTGYHNVVRAVQHAAKQMREAQVSVVEPDVQAPAPVTVP